MLPNEEEVALAAKWQTVQDALEKRLKPLGLRVNHDCWFHRNVKVTPYHAALEIRERSQLTASLLLACNEALSSVDDLLFMIIGIWDAEGTPESLAEVSGGGFTTIAIDAAEIVVEAYRQIGINIEP